jgi:hypothetical protein
MVDGLLGNLLAGSSKSFFFFLTSTSSCWFVAFD